MGMGGSRGGTGMGLRVALQQQQQTMCEMKSSCPVPRGSVQHTEQGLGLGRGLQGGARLRGSPAPHRGCASSWRGGGRGALGMGAVGGCCGGWRLWGAQPC